MTNYKTEQEKQDKEFKKTMLVTLGGSWLECSDYEGTVAEMESYLLSRDTALLEAFKKDVGEMKDIFTNVATFAAVCLIMWGIASWEMYKYHECKKVGHATFYCLMHKD